MILGYGKKLKQDWGLASDAQLFFVLRWQELFDENAYDSWQVRSCNVRSILEEMLVVLEMAATVHSAYVALTPLGKEATDIAKRDHVINKEYSHVRFVLEKLCQQIEINK